MKRLASWSAILAVTVLALGSAAQAVSVDLNLNFYDGTGSLFDGSGNQLREVATNDVLTWDLTITVHDNTFVPDPASGSPLPLASGVTELNLGAQGASIGVSSTANIGQFPKDGFSGKPLTSIYNTCRLQVASVRKLTLSPAFIENGGLKPVFLALPAKSGLDGSNYVLVNSEITDTAPSVKAGSDTVGPLTYASGSFTVTGADGTSSTYAPFVETVSPTSDLLNLLVYMGYPDATINQVPMKTSDAVNFNGKMLTVGALSAGNTPPTAAY